MHFSWLDAVGIHGGVGTKVGQGDHHRAVAGLDRCDVVSIFGNRKDLIKAMLLDGKVNGRMELFGGWREWMVRHGFLFLAPILNA
jgi:hypothetical protein